MKLGIRQVPVHIKWLECCKLNYGFIFLKSPGNDQERSHPLVLQYKIRRENIHFAKNTEGIVFASGGKCPLICCMVLENIWKTKF